MLLVTVLIVEDDDLFRQTTLAWLEPVQGIAVVGVARDHRQAISLIHKARPDVLLLGIGSLSTSNLLAVLKQIRDRFPRLKIIALHEDGQQDLVLEAFKAGVMGHLVKGMVQPDELVAAICTVKRGDVVLNSSIAGSMLDEIIRKRL